MNHHKHPPIPKPALGEWGRNEIAIIGAPCADIRALAETFADAFKLPYQVCYIDADHTEETEFINSIKHFSAVFTDKIHGRRLDIQSDLSQYNRRALLAGQDLILVNGNHFTAKEQIVLLHSQKLTSLQRKTDRLTDVIAVVEMDTPLADCSFLHAFLPAHTKVFSIDQFDALQTFLRARISPAAAQGLVLAGGQSIRMGTDKSLLQYHGMAQRDYMMSLFAELRIPAWLSRRSDQRDTVAPEYDVLVDRFVGIGPYGAILTAMMSAPDCAWMVVASDLPLVTRDTFEELLRQRNPAKVATAFHNPATGFPEPLITIWEPKAYPVLLSFLAQGSICPRKALINSDILQIEAADPDWLINVNTPEDVDALRKRPA